MQCESATTPAKIEKTITIQAVIGCFESGKGNTFTPHCVNPETEIAVALHAPAHPAGKFENYLPGHLTCKKCLYIKAQRTFARHTICSGASLTSLPRVT
jgi:hypothetical protein